MCLVDNVVCGCPSPGGDAIDEVGDSGVRQCPPGDPIPGDPIPPGECMLPAECNVGDCSGPASIHYSTTYRQQ